MKNDFKSSYIIMFRRAFASGMRIMAARKFTTGGTAGIGFLAAGTALAISIPSNASWSDENLNKKPFWYRDNVHRLEHVLKKLSQYSYIEDEHFIDEAIDLLRRVENLNNFEVSWRLGRAMVEKANLYPKTNKEKRMFYLEKAVSHLEKAFTLEPPNSKWSGAAHKWFAIALMRINDLSIGVSIEHPAIKKYKNEILEHLDKAIKSDPNDAIAYHTLGLKLFKNGKYAEALKYFRATEELKGGYYPANMTYMGIAIHKIKKKDVAESVSILKQALSIVGKNREDRKAKLLARSYLINYLGQKQEEIATREEY